MDRCQSRSNGGQSGIRRVTVHIRLSRSVRIRSSWASLRELQTTAQPYSLAVRTRIAVEPGMSPVCQRLPAVLVVPPFAYPGGAPSAVSAVVGVDMVAI